ncbi:MAG: nitrogen fixation protein NifH [Actinomycetota bacterium]
MEAWRAALKADPLPWLLDREDPAVRHLALLRLCDEPEDAGEVRRARRAAMRADPIAATLSAQDPEGFWDTPGAGYGPKYTGTVWSVIFLEQFGADGSDPRIRAACRYVLGHTQAASGGFGATGALSERPPPPSTAIHCLHGNLLRSLIAFGWLDDERVKRAVAWEASAITGDGHDRFYASATSGPGFACGVNGGLPCGWGGVKAMRALVSIPPRRRTRAVRAAIRQGTDFLLSVDPSTAAYPTDTRISSSWFRLGFPSGYVADVLQMGETLAELGFATDPRLEGLVDLLLGKQLPGGVWRNEYAYHGKTWVDVDRRGGPSKWVTLRAATFLKAALG